MWSLTDTDNTLILQVWLKAMQHVLEERIAECVCSLCMNEGCWQCNRIAGEHARRMDRATPKPTPHSDASTLDDACITEQTPISAVGDIFPEIRACSGH